MKTTNDILVETDCLTLSPTCKNIIRLLIEQEDNKDVYWKNRVWADVARRIKYDGGDVDRDQIINEWFGEL